MAAALLQHALKVQPEPLKHWRVVSAGVAARGGERVSENSVTALKKVGLDISQHRSQPLTQRLVSQAKAVFVMTENHRSMVQLMFDPPPQHVYLLREFMPNTSDKQIVDPYGGPLSIYEACRDEMVEAIPTLTEFLKQLAASEARS
jgi:protein-tyrosine-phosphatase